MPDPLVLRSVPMPTLGDAHEHPAARTEAAQPARQRGGVVLHVLENLERADDVEDLRWGEVLRGAVEHPSGWLDAPLGGRERDGIRLEADVVESPREAGANRPETGTDLEQTLGRGREEAPDDVVTEPRRER